MWSIDACRLLASSLLSAVFVFAGGWRPASGQSFPVSPQPEETLEYRVHKGESLADIARLFHLTPDELAQANGITDPTRLQIEQPLKVPNMFARQAAQLREERDGLAAEKAQLVRQVAAQAQVLAGRSSSSSTTRGRRLRWCGHWRGPGIGREEATSWPRCSWGL
jgi:LysM repeat protein